MINDILGILFFCALVFSSVFGFAFWFESSACDRYSEMTGRNTEWFAIGGCFVEHGDRMIPKDEYKLVELKND
tara:strand:+ start:7615 stop:7833 length:219 start_codon:yes stop_codon:yes gene_type:complete